MENIDRRYVTPEFLLKYFPDPDKFHKLSSNPKQSILAASEEIYIKWKDSINKKRRKSGKPPLSDSDLVNIIKKSEGVVKLIAQKAILFKKRRDKQI